MAPNEPTSSVRRRVGFIAGIGLFLLILIAPLPPGMSPEAKRMAAVVALMALWWITEALHIAVTALVPLAAFPLLGIMPSSKVAPHYTNHLIFLFFGGFVIALAMEKWDLHRRLALGVIAKMGGRPSRLVLGFMVATAFLSMWVSNTATTMMMLPVAMAVVKQAAESASIDGGRDAESARRVQETFGLVLLLGVAFSASIGGVATVVGTPTNVALLGFVQERFPQRPPITFLDWMLVGVPLVVVFLPFTWFYLCRFGGPLPLSRIRFSGGRSVIEEERRKLGPMKRPEKIVVAVASATALLWIFRLPLHIGPVSIPGWSSLFSHPSFVHDATVAMLAALVLCMIPVNLSGGVEWKGRWELFVMDWGMIQRELPWGVIFLFGGGFALAAGMQESGLAHWIGSLIGELKGTPIWIVFPIACALTATLTNVTSNTATILMLCPVLAEAAIELGIEPYLLLIPATVVASFAFLLPVATPPNAIVFSSGWVTVPAMFRAGLVIQIVSLVLVPAMVYALGNLVFHFGG